MTRGARSRERAIALVVAVLLAGTSAIGGPPPVRATEPTPSAPPTEILGAETPAPATTPEPLPTAEPTPAPPVETPAVATPPPVETPTPAPEPTATPDPTATPAPADVPGLAPLPPGATELVEKRTESSRTYLDATGRMTSELYTEPVFYKPEGSSTLVPVEVGFRATDDPGTSAVSDRAPVAVSVAAPTSADGFLAVTAGGTRVAFALPADLARDASRAEPVVAGAVADYAEITPGVGLRVIAGAEGATSFFVWRAAPAEPTLRFVVEAPGLALALTKEGTIEARDAAGTLVGIIPRPYAVDSTPDPFAGSGRFTDRVSLALAPDGRTVTVAVDEGWLATATYPVYVDPTYYNAGSLSYGDAHIASGYPTQNFADYVRPDSPYYHELWLGTDPSGTSGASHDYLRWDVAPFAGTTIDTASFAIYPYHQYYDAPATTPTWLRQVIEAPNGTWRETDPTWNNRSSYSYDLWTSEACVEGSTCTFNTSTVRTIVQGWATSPAANFGIRLDEAGCGSGSDACPNTHWKRLIAAEHTGADSFKPKMTVTWHVPSATAIAKPAFTGSRAFAWTYAGSPGQTKYQVQLSSDGGATWPAGLDGGHVTSGAASWTAPDGMALADLTTYTWHVRAYDGHSWSAYSAASSFTFDAYRRGDEPYYTRVPFDLGGGWSLDVGVHSGEARLARSLFSIGAIGPPAGLDLTYNSSDIATAGAFGAGWSSNLTQHLAITGSLAIWTRADGGRVAFTLAGGVWTAVPGHTDKLALASGEYTVTETDQTRLVFESTGAYRLKRIVDRFGKALALTYPANQIVATDAVGRATTLQLATFNGTLRVDYATDAAGRTWDLAYDTSTGTDLKTITEPAPGGGAATPTTNLTYDSSHRLTRVDLKRDSVTDRVTWKVGYDAAGKATSVVDPIAHASYADVANTFTYGAGNTVAGLLKTYSPAVRNSTTYSFDRTAGSRRSSTPGASRRRRPGMPPGTWPRSAGRSRRRRARRRPTSTTGTGMPRSRPRTSSRARPGPPSSPGPGTTPPPTTSSSARSPTATPRRSSSRSTSTAATASSRRSSPTARAAGSPRPPTPRPAPAEAPRMPRRTSGPTSCTTPQQACSRSSGTPSAGPPSTSTTRSATRPRWSATTPAAARPCPPGARPARAPGRSTPRRRSARAPPSRARSRRRSASPRPRRTPSATPRHTPTTTSAGARPRSCPATRRRSRPSPGRTATTSSAT